MERTERKQNQYTQEMSSRGWYARQIQLDEEARIQDEILAATVEIGPITCRALAVDCRAAIIICLCCCWASIFRGLAGAGFLILALCERFRSITLSTFISFRLEDNLAVGTGPVDSRPGVISIKRIRKIVCPHHQAGLAVIEHDRCHPLR